MIAGAVSQLSKQVVHFDPSHLGRGTICFLLLLCVFFTCVSGGACCLANRYGMAEDNTKQNEDLSKKKQNIANLFLLEKINRQK